MRIRLLALAGLLLALTGCDSAGSPSVGGVYSGSVTVSGLSVDYELDIADTDGGSFTWSGEAHFTDGSHESFGGTGTYDHPDIAFTVTGDDPSVIDGTVSNDGDTLTLTDNSEGVAITLVLTRE